MTKLENVFMLKSYYTSILISEVTCNFDVLYEQNYQSRLIGFPHIWITFGNINQLIQYNFYIPINALFLNANYDNQSRAIMLKYLYKFNKRFEGYMFHDVGTWTSGTPFQWNEFIVTRNRSNFLKEPLTVSYVVTNVKLYKNLEDYRNTFIDSWSKVSNQCFKFISDLYNITHKQLFRPDWSVASIQDSKVPGMYGDVVRGEADSCGTSTFTPKERHVYFRYIYFPLKELGRSAYFQAPPLAYYSNLFFLPFEKTVWMTFGMLVILCCIASKIAFDYEQKLTDNLIQNEDDAIISPSWWDVILMQIAVICQMDMYYQPKNLSGKMAAFIILILSTFLFTAFSARIVLLLQSHTDDIKNMDDLVSAKYVIVLQDTPFNKFFVMVPSFRSNERLRKGFAEETLKKTPGNSYYLSTTEGLKLVRDTYTAFQGEHSSAHYVIGKTFSPAQTCALRTVEPFFKQDVTYLCCNRNTSYYEHFLVGFKRLIDAGIQSRERKRGFIPKPACRGGGSTYVRVGVVECYFAYLAFGIGICLALTFFCLELGTSYYLKHRKFEIIKVRPHDDKF
ncbi:hypothetical protein GWI33_012351 [Rhynchophorus ferrugineus]|uniref:Ionotropic receptor n=1 Tax=Rhynchophorus ferrugineus TaxID=354439 RepID=A0A834MJT2_RHYFE|nr:hypothetical protein GWI33_012351 [Rhynchophorus ferrugineus]